MARPKTAAGERREKLVKEFWRNEDAWTGENEKGWFFAPRTLPLVLGLLGSKEISGNQDPTRVYLELVARHIDGGLVELGPYADHAYAAGYDGPRGIRSWQERMKLLEQLGFIKTKKIGNHLFRYVLLIHPTAAIQRLRDARKVSDHWWETYRARQIETKETFYEQRSLPKEGAPIGGRKRRVNSKRVL
jgi:hypothetical protein